MEIVYGQLDQTITVVLHGFIDSAVTVSCGNPQLQSSNTLTATEFSIWLPYQKHSPVLHSMARIHPNDQYLTIEDFQKFRWMLTMG